MRTTPKREQTGSWLVRRSRPDERSASILACVRWNELLEALIICEVIDFTLEACFGELPRVIQRRFLEDG